MPSLPDPPDNAGADDALAFNRSSYEKLRALLDGMNRAISSGGGNFVSGINFAGSIPQRQLQAVLIKVTGKTPSGGSTPYPDGLYAGKIAFGIQSRNAADPPTLPDGMTLPADEDCVVTYLGDFDGADTASGSFLTTPCWRIGRVTGRCLDNSSLRMVVVDAPPRGMFLVKLAQVAGTNGNATTACSYTYDVSIYGTTTVLAAGQAVARPRDRVGPVTAANAGYATYLANGSLLLLEAWEVWDAGTC